MKKAFVILLVAIMLLSIPVEVFAEMPDFAAMSEEEIHELIDLARNELKKRELNFEEKMILFEQDGVTVYLTGYYNCYGSDNVYLELYAVAINDSDHDISVSFDSATINGWDVYNSGIYEVTAHHKKKGDFEFCLTDADITSFEEVEEIIFNLYLYDSAEWERISTLDTIIVNFN